MAPKGRSGNHGGRGFAAMDDERKRSIASKGGFASARGNKTSNRGFASMDKNRQREISSMGGKASGTVRSHRPEDNDAEDGRQNVADGRYVSDQGPTSLESTSDPELVEKTQENLASSETDEDEDEGLGDGNLGRSSGGVM